MTEINLRAATQHDDELILELLKDMHREAGMGTINLDKVVNVIRHCREMGCIIIAEVQGIPRAIMGIRADKFWWSDDFAIFDQFTYVAPEARKTRAIFKMVAHARDVAVQAGIPLVIGNLGPVDTEVKSRLFKMFGKQLGITVITGETRNFLWR